MYAIGSRLLRSAVVLATLLSGLSSCDSQSPLDARSDENPVRSDTTTGGTSLFRSTPIPDTTLWLASQDVFILYPSEYITFHDSSDLEFEITIEEGTSISPAEIGTWLRATISSEGKTVVKLTARHPHTSAETTQEFVISVHNYCDVFPLSEFNKYLAFETGHRSHYQFETETLDPIGPQVSSVGDLWVTVDRIDCLPNEYFIRVTQDVEGTRTTQSPAFPATSEPLSSSTEVVYYFSPETTTFGPFTSLRRLSAIPWPVAASLPDTLEISDSFSGPFGEASRATWVFVEGKGLIHYRDWSTSRVATSDKEFRLVE